MKLIVTGGAGFIGSHLAEYLASNHYDVTVIDNAFTGNLENLKPVHDKIEFVNLNILDYEGLKKLLKNADCVFHQAALTSVQDSFTKQQQYVDVNVKGTENIFRMAQDYGFKVIFASSAAVYGNPKQIPIKEDFERRPLNPYGQTKLKSELLAEKYSKLGTKIIGLRYFNVYGMRQNPAYAGVITKFLTSIKNQHPLVIHGDGLQTRDFVYVGDVVYANYLAMKSKNNYAIVNIGSGISVSINELANMFIDVYHSSVKLIHDEIQQGDVRFSQADIDLAKKLFEWEPKTSLKNWLKSMLKDNHKSL
ncbi:MAG: NAD-dependent epimerase/dehydratase family protein [Nitrosotalea sp.]